MHVPEFDMWSSYLPDSFKEQISLLESELQKLPIRSSLALFLEMTRDYLVKKIQNSQRLESDDEFLLIIHYYYSLVLGRHQIDDSLLTGCSEEVAASLQVLLLIESYRLKARYDEALEVSDAFPLSDFNWNETFDVKKLFLHVWFKLTILTLFHNLNQITELKKEIETIMGFLDNLRSKSTNLPEGALISWMLRVEMWQVNLRLLDSSTDVNAELTKLEKRINEFKNGPFLLDRVTLARYHNFIAVLATRIHQLARAKRHYEHALTLSQEVGYERGYYLYSMNYLYVLLDLLYYDEVFQRARELSEYWLNNGNYHYFLVARELMIRVLRIRHQKEEAARILEETAKTIENVSIVDLTLLSILLDHVHDLPVPETTALIIRQKFDNACRLASAEYKEQVAFIRKELELSREFHSFNWPRALALADELFKEAFFKKKVDILLKILMIRVKIHLFSYMIFANPNSLKNSKKALDQYENFSQDLQYAPGILGSLLGKALVDVLDARDDALQRNLGNIRSFLDKLKASFNMNQSEINQFMNLLELMVRNNEQENPEVIAHSVMHYVKLLNTLSLSHSYHKLPDYKIHGVLFYSFSGSPLHAFWLDDTITEQLVEASTDLDTRQKEALLSGFLSAIKSFAASLFGGSERTYITHGPFLVLQRQIPGHEIITCLIVSDTTLFQGQIILDDLVDELKEDVDVLTRFRKTVATGVQDANAINELEIKIRDFFIKRGLLA